MNDHSHLDPYQLRPEDSRDPPRAIVDTYRMIGPGLILAGGLVGSGELVATTVLGAEHGFRLPLACLRKPRPCRRLHSSVPTLAGHMFLSDE